jgi:hypothetical protein
MAYLHYEDKKDFILHLVNDTVVSYPQAEESSLSFLSLESFGSGRTRSGRKGDNTLIYPLPVSEGNSSKLALCSGKDFNAVGQSSPNSFRACS